MLTLGRRHESLCPSSAAGWDLSTTRETAGGGVLLQTRCLSGDSALVRMVSALGFWWLFFTSRPGGMMGEGRKTPQYNTRGAEPLRLKRMF